MTKLERLVVIGASGSIGMQTLEVLTSACKAFEVVGVAVNTNVAHLSEWLDHFPKIEAVAASGVDDLALVNVRVYTGSQAVQQLLESCTPNVVLIAADTIQALEWTETALRLGARTLVATKELLALAADLLVERFGQDRIVPIDSEMTSLYVLLSNFERASVQSLLLTASGGRYWRKPLEELNSITPEEALRHPRWNMGAKVSIDSAMLVNKVIEAVSTSRLFGFAPQQIQIVIHPQAFVHAALLLKSGAAVQLVSEPDMRLAIAQALCGNALPILPQFDHANKKFEFYQPEGWSKDVLELFAEAATDRAKALSLLVADELAISAFLKGKITLAQAIRFVLKAFEHPVNLPQSPSVEELIQTYHQLKHLLAAELPQ